MPRGFSGNLIFAIIARMLGGNHLNFPCFVISSVVCQHVVAVVVYCFYLFSVFITVKLNFKILLVRQIFFVIITITISSNVTGA